jgi:hypothetical protein
VGRVQEGEDDMKKNRGHGSKRLEAMKLLFSAIATAMQIIANFLNRGVKEDDPALLITIDWLVGYTHMGPLDSADKEESWQRAWDLVSSSLPSPLADRLMRVIEKRIVELHPDPERN